MKKNLMIAICSLLLQTAVVPGYHAAFIPWILPETSILPSGAEILRPNQTFAYSMEEVEFYGTSQNLYLTAWNGGVSSGFHWRTATPVSGVPFVEGPGIGGEGVVHISSVMSSGSYDFDVVYDLNTVFLREPGGDTYIIATFYGSKYVPLNRGHFAQIYRWDPSGVTLLSTITLSTSPDYGRISMDAHRTYAAAMAWEVGGILYMKGIHISSGMSVSPTMTVPAPYQGYIPDIAFGHPNTSYLRARMVFVSNPLSRPTVIHIDFMNLMSATPSFVLDDINFDAFPFPLPVWGGSSVSTLSYPLGENLKIDCPDHSENDEWAYVYTTNLMKVNARGRNTGAPSTVTLTGAAPAVDAGFYNQQLAIHFNRNGRVYSGWRTNYPMFAPGQKYIGKIFNFGGSVPVDYPEISNTSLALSSIAFSKQDDRAHCLFASYLYGSAPTPSSYDLRYKLKPFNMGIQFSEVKEIEDVSIGVYPNPVTDHVNINYSGDPAKLFSLNAVNIMGQSVLTVKGNVVDIQQELNQSLGRLSPGQYVLHFRESEGSFEKSIKLVKQ